MRRAAALLITITVATAVLGADASAGAKTCKQCEEQLNACKKNYSAETCKVEYQVCKKSCPRR